MDNKLEKEIVKILFDLGISPSIKGYRYLVYAVYYCHCITLPNISFSKDIYPRIAEHFETTASSVERAIRHAINTGWCRHDHEASARIFGNTIYSDIDIPSNAVFISAVAEWIRLNYDSAD
ncbi:MAG: Stage 0 sporulation protein A [Firmicutes bacterium ADurb.BinA205]|nr:MAG: Stage 0 sporulation protein A [Firmicutes bacterium ADurb.BinA205]